MERGDGGTPGLGHGTVPRRVMPGAEASATAFAKAMASLAEARVNAGVRRRKRVRLVGVGPHEHQRMLTGRRRRRQVLPSGKSYTSSWRANAAAALRRAESRLFSSIQVVYADGTTDALGRACEEDNGDGATRIAAQPRTPFVPATPAKMNRRRSGLSPRPPAVLAFFSARGAPPRHRASELSLSAVSLSPM